jgi:hypothetical protein
MIVAAHQRRLQSLLSQKPDLTLKELREAVELKCSLPAIHYALEAMGLTYKRHSERANKTAPTSHGRAKRGADDNWVGTGPTHLHRRIGGEDQLDPPARSGPARKTRPR